MTRTLQLNNAYWLENVPMGFALNCYGLINKEKTKGGTSSEQKKEVFVCFMKKNSICGLLKHASHYFKLFSYSKNDKSLNPLKILIISSI